MGFLSGLGKGLHRAFDGNNIAITQAILAGDYQTAAALRARQDALQRQLQQEREQADARDAQVIGAKNMGIGQDEIRATGGQALSWLARDRAALHIAGQGGGPAAKGEEAAPQPAPGGAAPVFALPPGSPPTGPSFASASGRFLGPPGFTGGAAPDGPGFQAAAFAAPRSRQMAALAGIPRLRTHAQAASLARGTRFFAPDGSLREII